MDQYNLNAERCQKYPFTAEREQNLWFKSYSPITQKSNKNSVIGQRRALPLSSKVSLIVWVSV